MPTSSHFEKNMCLQDRQVVLGLRVGAAQFFPLFPWDGDGSPSSAVKAVQTGPGWIWLEAETRLAV